MKYKKQKKKPTRLERFNQLILNYFTIIFRDGFYWLIGILDALVDLVIEIISQKIFKLITGIILITAFVIFAILLLQIWIIDSAPWLQKHIVADFIIYNASAAILNLFVTLFKTVIVIIRVLSSGNFSQFKSLVNPAIPFLGIGSIETVASDVGQCHASISGSFTVVQTWVQYYAGSYICLWDELLWPTILHEPTNALCSPFYKGSANPHEYGKSPDAACGASSKHSLGDIVCLVLTTGELGLVLVSFIFLTYLLATPKTLNLIFQILKPIQFLYT